MEYKTMGYARVSSKEQNIDRQLILLRQYVLEQNILIDKKSGKDTERPAYQALKGPLGLREGDCLVITSLDRLSRNKEDIKKELEWFSEHKIRIMILDLPTSLIKVPDGQQWIIDMIQNILIEVLASIAEQERLTIRKRQREGIEAAKRKGKHLGRPVVQMPKNFDEVYRCWKSGEITARRAMDILDLSSSTFYRIARKYEIEVVSKGQNNMGNES